MTLTIGNRTMQRGNPPWVMGILNVTPDSFSDGGQYLCIEAAVERGLEMIEQGAELIDIGPESTRPGAADVAADEQIERAVPVIRALRAANETALLSIDTRLASVAAAAIEAGAEWVNDTSAFRDDPALIDLVVKTGVAVVIMHRKGTPAIMQAGGGPAYDDVVGEIVEFLRERMEFAVRRGVDRSRIILDPGIGFGKRTEHNLLILGNLERFVALGQPVLLGASRKRMIGSVLGTDDPAARLAGSLACASIATMSGVAIIRAHDVRHTVETVRLCAAVKEGSNTDFGLGIAD